MSINIIYIHDKEKLLCTTSNLQTNSFGTASPKVDQHTGDTWLTHVTK